MHKYVDSIALNNFKGIPIGINVNLFSCSIFLFSNDTVMAEWLDIDPGQYSPYFNLIVLLR